MNARTSSNRIVAFLLALVLLSGILVPASPAFAADEEIRYVNVDWLNLRTGPGFDFKVYQILEYGHKLWKMYETKDAVWTRVSTADGVEGWVYSEYIGSEQPADQEPEVAVDAVTSVDKLNLRLGPGFGYSILKTLSIGQQLVVQGRSINGNWLQVRLPDGSGGWVFSYFVEMDHDIDSLPVKEAYGGPTTGDGSQAPSFNALVTIQNNIASVELRGFASQKEFSVSLGLPNENPDLVMASGKTGKDGSAVVKFEMPRKWSNGDRLVEESLVVTVDAKDGSFSRSIRIQYYQW